MATWVIVYQRPDSGVSQIIPRDGDRREGESDDDWAARLAASTVPEGVSWLRQDAASLPGRRFRDCWRFNDSRRVEVNVPLARTQRLAELRQRRNSLLLTSDGEKARLDDVGTAEQKQAYQTYRQALRDWPVTLTADLAALATATEIAEYRPSEPTP